MKYPLLLIVILALICEPANGASATRLPSAQTPTPVVSSVPLPPGAVARLGQGSVEHTEFSPDGKYVAVAGSIGMVVYDTSTFKPMWSARIGRVNAMNWSTDSQLLAASSSDAGISVWNGATGKWLYRLNGHYGHTLDWTLNNKRLVVASDKVLMWDLGVSTPVELNRDDEEGEYKRYGILWMDSSALTGDSMPQPIPLVAQTPLPWTMLSSSGMFRHKRKSVFSPSRASNS